jgi:hypothetical protein
LNTPRVVSTEVQGMTVENDDFTIEVFRSGEVRIQSKRTCAKASITPLPIGMTVFGSGSQAGDAHIALTRTCELLILDRARLYGL